MWGERLTENGPDHRFFVRESKGKWNPRSWVRDGIHPASLWESSVASVTCSVGASRNPAPPALGSRERRGGPASSRRTTIGAWKWADGYSTPPCRFGAEPASRSAEGTRRSFSRARARTPGINAPARPGRHTPRRRGPLRAGAQCESAAAALGVETQASLVVAVNELRVLAHRADDSTRVGGAAKHDLLIRGRLHGPERKASGGTKHRPNV